MWRERTLSILAQPVEALSVAYDRPGEPMISGKLITLDDVPYALGSFIAFGDEARVYELINLRDGERDRVVKICRHSPGSKKYATWAVPFRLAQNPMSTLADVELNSARLVKLPNGYAKVQRHFSGFGVIDWSSRRTVLGLTTKVSELELPDGLALVDAAIAHYGRQGLLIELLGRLHARAKQWEEARTLCEEAVVRFRAERSCLLQGAAMLLAHIYEDIYRAHPNAAAATFTLKLPDGTELRQQVFSDDNAMALDDTLQDRALYLMLEVLDHEPLFIPALLYLVEDYLSTHQIQFARALLDRVAKIDPANEQASALRSDLSLADEPGSAVAESTDLPVPPQGIPEHVLHAIRAHAAAYRPEADLPKLAEGRRSAFGLLLAHQQYSEALAVAEDWITDEPESIDAQYAKARALYCLDRLDEARITAEGAFELAPGMPALVRILCEIYFEQGQFEAALRYALLGIHDPAYARLNAESASRCYRKLGDRTNAVEFARRAFGDDFETERFAVNYVYILRARDEGASAEEEALADQIITRGHELHPDNGRIGFAYAQSLARRQMFQECTDALRHILQQDPNDRDAKSFLEAIESQLAGLKSS